MLISGLSISDVLRFAVGTFFLFSGGSKLLYSRAVLIHLEMLGLLPKRLNGVIAMMLIQIECALGFALVIGAYQRETGYLAGVMLISLSMVTIWGAVKKRIEDCGCYGMVLSVSPIRSLMINLAVLVALVVGWLLSDQGSVPTPMWKTFSVVGVLIAANLISKRSIRSPLFDLTLLRKGKPLPQGLFNQLELSGRKRGLILFLDFPCSACDNWLNGLATDRENRLGVDEKVCVFPLEKRETIVSRNDIPDVSLVRYLKTTTYPQLVYLTPTAVLVQDGVIVEKWVNRSPFLP